MFQETFVAVEVESCIDRLVLRVRVLSLFFKRLLVLDFMLSDSGTTLGSAKQTTEVDYFSFFFKQYSESLNLISHKK